MHTSLGVCNLTVAGRICSELGPTGGGVILLVHRPVPPQMGKNAQVITNPGMRFQVDFKGGKKTKFKAWK